MSRTKVDPGLPYSWTASREHFVNRWVEACRRVGGRPHFSPATGPEVRLKTMFTLAIFRSGVTYGRLPVGSDVLYRQQGELLADMVGPGWTFDPAWRTRTAVALAETAYTEMDDGILPVLADAVQDAGCDDDSLLARLRTDRPLYRGEWVVDHLLGKR